MVIKIAKLLKCNICKDKFDREDIIYAPKKVAFHYWCIDCYKKSTWYNESKLNDYIEKTKERFEEQNVVAGYSADLCTWFADNVGFLDARFYMKLANINKGKFGTKQFPLSPVSHKISNDEMYDMCLKMEGFIRKQLSSLKNKEHAVHYVLAMLYNSYPKYLQHKYNQPKIEDVRVVESTSSIIKKKDLQKNENCDTLDLNSFLL